MNSSEERRNVLDKKRSKRKKKKSFLWQEIIFFQYVNDIMQDLFGQRECHAQVFSYFKRTQVLQFLESLNYLKN